MEYKERETSRPNAHMKVNGFSAKRCFHLSMMWRRLSMDDSELGEDMIFLSSGFVHNIFVI